jgi:uncharacterized membrane protein YgcG
MMLNRLWHTLALSIAALAVGAVIAAPTASAAENISQYNVAVTLTPEAVMQVVETINYDFDGQLDRHGIQRDLVIQESLSGGGTQIYEITLDSITADGAPVPFTTTESGDFLSVRIGDPDVNVTGTIEYEVKYSVTGAVRPLTAEEASAAGGLNAGDVELYWDVIGDGWGVPISSALASVNGPTAASAAACYYGTAGSTNECMIAEIDGDLITEQISLAEYESLTIVAAYPASAFTEIPTPNIEPPFVIPGIAWIISLLVALIALIAPIGFVLVKRRDLRGKALDGAPVQFEPPDSVRPAQLQAALDGKVDARGAVATLLDLTARGYLTMSADDGGLLQKDSLTISRTTKASDSLAPWESAFVSGVMGTASTKTIAGYDPALAAAISQTSNTLETEAENSGRRTTTRNNGLRAALIVLGFVGFILGFLMLIVMPSGSGVLALIPGLLLLIACLIASRLVPVRETAESASFQSRARGFRKLLDTDAAEARREFAQRSGLQPFAIFATMLPYAVIFGLSESWTQAFPEITDQQLNEAGFYFGSTWAMYAFISSAEASVVMAATEPSRDSGSGFSGGDAGGGGGGGGGGSW